MNKRLKIEIPIIEFWWISVCTIFYFRFRFQNAFCFICSNQNDNKEKRTQKDAVLHLRSVSMCTLASLALPLLVLLAVSQIESIADAVLDKRVCKHFIFQSLFLIRRQKRCTDVAGTEHHRLDFIAIKFCSKMKVYVWICCSCHIGDHIIIRCSSRIEITYRKKLKCFNTTLWSRLC